MTAITAVTPNPNVIAPRSTGAVSFIRTVYIFFQEDATPLITKIATAALAAFATLGAGYLLGSTLLFTTMMATIVSLTGYMESKNIQNEATIESQKRQFAHLQVTDAMGGQMAVNQNMDELDLGNRESDTGAIDFLRLDEVRTPQRGVDKYGRHFYAFPISNRHNESRHLLVLYEKHTSGDAWEVLGPQDFFHGALTAEGLEIINSLVASVHENYQYREYVPA